MLWWRSEDVHIVHICSPPGLQNMYNIVVCRDVWLVYFFALDMQWITHFCVICIAFAVMFFIFLVNKPFYSQLPISSILFILRYQTCKGAFGSCRYMHRLIHFLYRIVDHNCITLLGKKHLYMTCTYNVNERSSPLRIPARGVLLCQGERFFWVVGLARPKVPVWCGTKLAWKPSISLIIWLDSTLSSKRCFQIIQLQNE